MRRFLLVSPVGAALATTPAAKAAEFDRSKVDDILGGKVAVTADAHLGG